MVTNKSALDSKQALLDASVAIFADKGLEGATVKDIADAANVNVALVSYHFGGKEGLYRAVLLGAGQDRLEASERMLKPATSPEEFKIRLKMFAEEFMHCHHQNPYLMKIIHRDFDGGNEIALEMFRGIFFEMYMKVKMFVVSGIEQKILREDLDADCTTAMLFGSLVHSLRTDFLRKEILGVTLQDPVFASKFIDQFVKNFCEGSFPRSTP